MIYLFIIALILLNLFWFLLVFLGLPGNWLIVITTCAFAWWQKDHHLFSAYTLAAMGILALTGELVEFFAGMTGAKKAGAGWRGSLGALCGGLPGAVLGTFLIPIPLVGTIFGAATGAGFGSFLAERAGGRDKDHAVKIGLSASKGSLLGTATKLLIGFTLLILSAFAAFWP